MKRIFVRSLLVMMLAMIALPAIASTSTDKALPAADMFTGMLVAGLVINSASIAALFKNFNTIFNEAVAAYKPQWQKVAMEVPSTTSENLYAWLEALSGMREFLGGRQYKNIKPSNWTVRNKTWEHTIAVPATAIKDDQYGVYSPVVKFQSAVGLAQPDDLVFGLMNDGFTEKGYDEKTFFATDHASGSNKASGGSSVLSTTSFGIAMAKIKRQKNAGGQPMFSGSEQLILVVGPELEETARVLMNNDYVSVASGSTQNNPWKGAATPLVSPKITSSTAWFLLINFYGLMPFIFQNREALRFTQKTDPETSDHVFEYDEFLYGLYSRNNAAYGLHQLAYGSVGA